MMAIFGTNVALANGASPSKTDTRSIVRGGGGHEMKAGESWPGHVHVEELYKILRSAGLMCAYPKKHSIVPFVPGGGAKHGGRQEEQGSERWWPGDDPDKPYGSEMKRFHISSAL